MYLCLAEKPDVAKKIVAAFPKYKKHDLYYEIMPCNEFPDGAYVAYCMGHLLTFDEEKMGTNTPWSLSGLPIMPKNYIYKPIKGREKHVRTIKKLANDPKVTMFINCCDSAREGMKIFTEIIKYVTNRNLPTKCLWISSLTPASIKKGMQELVPYQTKENLYHSAYARAIADFLVGINLSRSVSLRMQSEFASRNSENGDLSGLKREVFSIGRCQSPTLRLVYDRIKQIEAHVPEPFWTLSGTFEIDGKEYTGRWFKEDKNRFECEEEIEELSIRLVEEPAVIKEVKKERKAFKPPQFFDLTRLQSTANKLFKMDPKETLHHAENLYLVGLLSYPRADNPYITAAEAPILSAVLEKLKYTESYSKYLPAPIRSSDLSSRYINEKKVSDHHGIIVLDVPKDFSKLNPGEKAIYDLVVKRVIAAHHEDALYDFTSIITVVDETETFLTKGKQEVSLGWKMLYQKEQVSDEKDDQEEENEEVAHLPDVKERDKGTIVDTEINKGMTKAPPYLTPGTLVELMENCGSLMEEKEMQKILKKTSGIGTVATRDGIIHTLYDRGYLVNKNNKVLLLEKGRMLMDALGDKMIVCSPELTAKWENVLEAISDGRIDYKQFIGKAEKLVVKLLNDIEQISKSWNLDSSIKKIEEAKRKEEEKKLLGLCLKCGSQVVLKKGFYGCTAYSMTGCDFQIKEKILGKKISSAQVKKLLKDGKTNTIKGFKKGEDLFDAVLSYNVAANKLEFKKPEIKEKVEKKERTIQISIFNQQ
ncbi:type IA DNA topoisomerase [Bacillus thuringiensis]|uniref:type IA DNA topoisomerase n=1 Tax=Bacillus thuringiensis TaxID=1428 RepID=UPI0020CF76CB|nr:type IA DNA topoisomerase [Bacillus thuringiensis]